jgi:hypothetical protein
VRLRGQANTVRRRNANGWGPSNPQHAYGFVHLLHAAAFEPYKLNGQPRLVDQRKVAVAFANPLQGG